MLYNGSIFLLVVIALFALTLVVQLYYYLYYYLAIYRYNEKDNNQTKEPVSIIICARNEADNLSNFLPSVLEQDYPNYEVIVVNDCSEDNSFYILGQYLGQYPHLKVSNVNKDPKFTHNKKFARFLGIKAAKNDILLFTDADCQPGSDKWLETMASHFNENISFVLGYGGYLNKKGLLNKYIRYDSVTVAMQYLSRAIRGIPYMGVGRNLAYRRSVFFNNKGFGPHNHLISGDDDLLVNTNAVKSNTAVEFSKGAHTRSVPSSGLREWIKQKKRHLSTAPYYKFGDKLLLITEPFTRILFYSAFIILISNLFLWPVVLMLFVIRLIIQITVIVNVQKRLNEPGLLIYSLFFDIFSPVINGILLLSNLRRKPDKNKWK